MMTSRFVWVVTCGLLGWVCLPAAKAQKAFPNPGIFLEDLNHKEEKSGLSMNEGTLVIRPGVGTPSTINHVSFSPDGSMLAAAKDFGRVVVFDVEKKMVLRAFQTRQGMVQNAAISLDRTLLATSGSSERGSITIWQLSDGKQLRKFTVGDGDLQLVTFLPDGKLLIKLNGGSLLVVNAETGSKNLSKYFPRCSCLLTLEECTRAI